MASTFAFPDGAGRGTRTPTLSLAADFESAASTDSAIPACTMACQTTLINTNFQATHYIPQSSPLDKD